MKSKTTIWGLVAGIALVIGCLLYFLYIVPYHVRFKEQIQLFVFSSSYILSYFTKPAAFACLGGDFLTQFFYLIGGGTAIITLLLLTEWRLIFATLKRFSSVKTQHATSLQTLGVASLLPVMIEWILYPDLFFSVAFSVSFIIALSAFIIYAKTNGNIAVGILLIPALYITAGASVFLFVILAIFYDIYVGRRRFIYWTIALVFSIALPFILRHIYLLTLKQAFFYPYLNVKQASSLVALALIVLLFVCFKNRANTIRGFWANAIRPYILFVIIIVLLIAGLVKTTVRNRNQEYIFGISIEAYYNHWDKVLEIAEKAKLKSPVATCYTNIALSKKSLLGERLMDFYQPFSSGLLIPMTPSAGWFTIFSGSDAYYHIGDMSMAQHAAMLGMIFSPNQRSARMMERLVETNIATGDTAVAMKYVRILGSTLFHQMKPDRLKDMPHRGIFKEDIIHRANDVKTSLELLVASDPDNLPALNYLLSYYLLTKDIPSFFKAYTAYYKGKYPPQKAYSEALLIYLAAEKSPVNEVLSYGVHSDIIKSFGEYTRLYEKSNGNLASMQKEFPNTYWLFYHFAVMNN